MTKYKSWLITAIITICIVLIGVGTAIAVIDPFFHYHAPISGFPYLIDNQLSQNPGMATNFDYDSVILGSSMTVNFNTNWFREELGLNTIKLNYSGAYPKDQANIMTKVFESDNDVKAVFLGVDVVTYMGDTEETKYPIPKYLYDDNVINDVEYLFNKDVFLNYILRQIADPEPTDLATVYKSWWTDEYYNIQWVMHNYEPPKKVTEELPVDAYIEGVEANLKENICPFIENNPDTTFYIFYPPYSVLYWNDVICENHLEATFEEYAYITDRLLEYDNVRVFYFPNEEWIVTDLNNYADYNHYSTDINHYMTECFADGTCEITSPGQMDEANDKMRKIIDEFDYETLFSQEW